MQVSDLQQFIRSLIPLVEGSGGGKKVIDDLEKTSQSLGPFAHLTMESLASFLVRAEEYDRTGIVPVTVKAAPKSKTPTGASNPRVAKTSQPQSTAEEVFRNINDVYRRAIGEGVTFEMIEAEIEGIVNPIGVPILKQAMNLFEISKWKNKNQGKADIIEKIKEYKSMHDSTKNT